MKPRVTKQFVTNKIFESIRAWQWKTYKGNWTNPGTPPAPKPYNPKPFPKIVGASESVGGRRWGNTDRFLLVTLGRMQSFVITESELNEAYALIDERFCTSFELPSYEIKQLVYQKAAIYGTSGDFLRYYQHPKKDDLKLMVADFSKKLYKGKVHIVVEKKKVGA